MHERLPFETWKIVMQPRTDMHDIVSLVGDSTWCRVAAQCPVETMLSRAPTRNLSIVMPKPIPWYEFSAGIKGRNLTGGYT